MDYTIEIGLKASLATPLQSDTIFGHICWAIRFLKWEIDDKLSDFLSLFDQKESHPPLLISNGFPKGYLSKPIVLPVTQDELETIVEQNKRIENSFIIKTIKKIDIIPIEKFRELQQGKITPKKLFRVMLASYDDIMLLKKKEQNVIVQHNTIDRIKGSVREGALYSQMETFFAENSGIFDVYLKTNYFSIEELKRIFQYIGTEGFGRDKSTGKGHFAFEIKEGIDVPEAEKPNAFMTLSSYIPNCDDPTRGYYSIIHKFGKLGSLYAKGISEVNGNPFKVPLVMFSAGSVFFDEDYRKDKVYGSLLRNVHKNTDIRHYAYAFPVGICVEQ